MSLPNPLLSPALRPYAIGVAAALAIFAAVTWHVRFPFMADDWGHLAASYSAGNLLMDHFGRSFSRVPVWAVVDWALFKTHVLETTWLPIYLFFLAHCAAVALLTRWLLQELTESFVSEGNSRWVTVGAVVIACLYPNNYEIVYWPTCMPYALGGLLMAAALSCRKLRFRVPLLIGSFLTYETFVLVTLTLLVASRLWGRAHAEVTGSSGMRRFAWLLPWVVAVTTTVAVRAAATMVFSGYVHLTDTSLLHVGQQAALALRDLFVIQFFSPPPNITATAAMWLLFALAATCLWTKERLQGVGLLFLTYASTAMYWILGYSAPRAIYGSQLFWAAVLAFLTIRAASLGRLPRRAVLMVMIICAAMFVAHVRAIVAIKDFNGQVLAKREADFAQRLRSCTSPCVMTYTNLEIGLQSDWVLNPNYWSRYFDYIRLKYAPDKVVHFQLSP